MLPNAEIVGGTILRIPAIQSPNFNLVSMIGWEILQTGQAYFFGIVTSGAFQGTNFVINSGGAFFYNGTPALGNLIAAITPTAGGDTFGNTVGSGFTITEPGGSLFNTKGSQLFNGGVIAPFTVNSGGASEQEQLYLFGPSVLSSHDSVGIFLTSTSKDLSIPASGQLVYEDTSSVNHIELTWGPGGVTFPNGPGVNMGTPALATATGTPTVGGTETRDAVLGNYVFTALAGHRYEARLDGQVNNGSVLADLYAVNIRNGGSSTPTAASPCVASSQAYIKAVGSADRDSVPVRDTFKPAAGTVTLSVFCIRIIGTGVYTPVSAQFLPNGRELYVVDLGLA